MKKNILFLLVILSIGVTIYINQTTKRLPDEVKQLAESILLEDEWFPARPVWWEDDKILAVGVLPEFNGDEAAKKACQLMLARSLPVQGLNVEVYDVLKIQRQDDWTLLGSSKCQ